MVRKYLAPLSVILRWGHLTTPTWVLGDLVTAPPANTNLVRVTATRRAWIYGFFISAEEGNNYLLEWVSGGNTRQFFIRMVAEGTVYFADTIPLNEGLPADLNTTIHIYNENAGSEGKRYQAAIMYGEEMA